MVASIIGYVFLALLALLVVLLLAPMVLGAELRDGQFTLWVRVLFVKMRLLPAREKPVKKKRKKPEKEEPEEEPREEEEQKTRGRTAQQWLELIRRIVSSFTAGMKLLCKMMLVYDVEVLIPVRADDPSQLAQRFGQVQAAVGATRAALENVLYLRYKRLVAMPDFADDDKIQPVLACKVAVSPVIIIAAGIMALLQYEKSGRYLKRMKAAVAAQRRAQRAEPGREQEGDRVV